jgi:hypothetical protein
MRNASDENCSKNQNTYFVFNTFLFRKSRRLRDKVRKHGTARQASGDNIKRGMRFPCWITKATDTHSEYVILLLHGNNGYANASLCYVIRTLPVMFSLNKRKQVIKIYVSLLH